MRHAPKLKVWSIAPVKNDATDDDGLSGFLARRHSVNVIAMANCVTGTRQVVRTTHEANKRQKVRAVLAHTANGGLGRCCDSKSTDRTSARGIDSSWDVKVSPKGCEARRS